MNLQKAPALVLAVALQIFPICREACVNQSAAPGGFAIVMRWLAGAAALLGSYHAVSGASAAISGVSNLNPIGPVTTNATGNVGQSFAYRIIVSNPGVNPQQAFYNASPLPPGLTINTNIGGPGYITGTPTAAGVYYPVTLTAGNANYSNVVTLPIIITITGSGGSPPLITGPPNNQTVQAGASVSFTVIATGSTPLSYRWKFNGAAISTASTSSLQLTAVKTTDSGTYQVTVTNAAGSASASATLTVNPASTPPSISAPPQSLTVSNGAIASFSVTASGTAPLRYQWLKGALNLASATNATYTIAAVSTNDAGSYSVVVTNSAGSITSSVANLTVLLSPSILSSPQSLTVTNGATASFAVVAAGSPPIAYQWKFNGADLVDATSSSLAITNVQLSNQGDYSVVVSNAVGALTSLAAHLTVQVPSGSVFQMVNLQRASGPWSFDVTGPTQTNYVIWSSTDLARWVALKTNFSATGTLHFTDSNAPAAVRFYRATLSP